MADLYRVKAPVVKVSIGSLEGNRVARILRAGGLVPAGVAEESLRKLEGRGFIEKVESDEAADEDEKAESDKAADEEADKAEKAAAEKAAGRTNTAKK